MAHTSETKSQGSDAQAVIDYIKACAKLLMVTEAPYSGAFEKYSTMGMKWEKGSPLKMVPEEYICAINHHDTPPLPETFLSKVSAPTVSREVLMSGINKLKIKVDDRWTVQVYEINGQYSGLDSLEVVFMLSCKLTPQEIQEKATTQLQNELAIAEKNLANAKANFESLTKRLAEAQQKLAQLKAS